MTTESPAPVEIVFTEFGLSEPCSTTLGGAPCPRSASLLVIVACPEGGRRAVLRCEACHGTYPQFRCAPHDAAHYVTTVSVMPLTGGESL
jgi:predicted RNA-binding Zn-ribbon protein involved in translation (DUF1610 family)